MPDTLGGFSWHDRRSKQVVYVGGDLHIHELSFDLHHAWSHADLTAITGAPLSSIDHYLVGYEWPDGHSKQVAYIGQDQHVHELSFELHHLWRHTDLTAITNQVAAYGAPFGLSAYAWPHEHSKQVVYVGSDLHIHELSLSRQHSWKHADLTAITGAPVPNAPVAVYISADGDSKRIDFIGADTRIYELSYHRQHRRHADLTALAGAPLALANCIAGYAWRDGQSNQVVYVSSDTHIHELSAHELAHGWIDRDLTALTGAPAGSGVDALSGYGWQNGHSKEVMYAPAGLPSIYELSGDVNDSWSSADLTAITGTTRPDLFAEVGYVWRDGPSRQVVFITVEDLHIHELTADLGQPWSHADLTAITGAPSPADPS